MKITFVGTSHGTPQANRFCTSLFLQVKDSCYIIDAGAPISPKLIRYGIPHEQVKALFVTHLHGDHLYGIFEFAEQVARRFKESNPKFLLSEEKGITPVKQFLNAVQSNKRELDFSVYGEGEIYRDENVTVTAIPTDHSNLPSYAFLVEAEGKRVLFTGDMHPEFTEADRLFKGRSFDLVVFEGAHAVLKDNIPFLGSIDTKKMVINHIYPVRNPEEDIKEIAGRLSFEFFGAADDMTVEI